MSKGLSARSARALAAGGTVTHVPLIIETMVTLIKVSIISISATGGIPP